MEYVTTSLETGIRGSKERSYSDVVTRAVRRGRRLHVHCTVRYPPVGILHSLNSLVIGIPIVRKASRAGWGGIIRSAMEPDMLKWYSLEQMFRFCLQGRVILGNWRAHLHSDILAIRRSFQLNIQSEDC